MKTKHYIIFSLLILFANTLFAQNRTIEFNHESWKEILATAKKENKLIYLDCYTTWCGPCKWMAKNIYTNDTAADFYNEHFINAKIDMEKGEGLDLAKKYEIRAYPTHLFINGDGEQIHRTCGSCSLETFVENGKNAIDPLKQLSAYSNKFKSGTLEGIKIPTYFEMLSNACQNSDSELDNYFSNQKDENMSSPINWYMMYNYVTNYSSKPFQYLNDHKDAYAKLYSMDSVEVKLNQVYQMKLNKVSDKTEVETIRSAFRKTGNKDAEKIIAETNINYCLKNKEYNAYAKAAADYMDKYNDISSGNMNAIAWTVYEKIDDKDLLKKATTWAKKATEIDDVYAFNDTYAALLYKLGMKQEAKTIAEKAIELAKKSGEDYSETEELLKKINKL